MDTNVCSGEIHSSQKVGAILVPMNARTVGYTQWGVSSSTWGTCPQDDDHAPTFTVVMVAQPCECAKHPWIVHSKLTHPLNHVRCASYANKPRKQKRGFSDMGHPSLEEDTNLCRGLRGDLRLGRTSHVPTEHKGASCPIPCPSIHPLHSLGALPHA